MEFKWGGAVSVPTQVVALWWNEVDATKPADILARVKGIAERGLYVFEARTDGNPNGAVVYVGQSGDKEKSNSQLGARISTSLSKLAYSVGALHYFFSDAWDVRVRWAAIFDQPLILPIETLLIKMHAPAFNAQHVRGFIGSGPELLVMNAGAKGRLLPVAATSWFRDAWPSPPKSTP